MSWWYLYNEDRELDAIILEINNSYWEKRNILLRIKPTSDKLRQPESSAKAEFLDRRQLVRSLPDGNHGQLLWRRMAQIYLLLLLLKRLTGWFHNE